MGIYNHDDINRSTALKILKGEIDPVGIDPLPTEETELEVALLPLSRPKVANMCHFQNLDIQAHR